MIATMETMDIIDYSEKLAEAVLQSEIADNYRRCKYILEHDQEAQDLIRKFTSMKEKYEEVQRFGKYHPDYDKVSTETRVLKRELDMNEVVANFKNAESDFEALLNELSGIIAKSVSDQIKVPTGNPFFDNLGCGGGCGSGGACNCG